MTTQQEIDMIRNEWFKDHVATFDEAKFPSGMPITRLRWGKPGTSCYLVIYVLYGSTLFVCGDLGEAVYQWPGGIDLKFLSECDISYFGGKCQASSSEPKGKTWDSDKVRRWIEEQLAAWAEENPIVIEPPDGDMAEELLSPRSPITFEKCCELMDYGFEEATTSAGAWADFIYNCGDGLILSDEPVKAKKGKLHTEYPSMSFEYSDDWAVGYTWDNRTRAHLIGLQMAAAQLEKT